MVDDCASTPNLAQKDAKVVELAEETAVGGQDASGDSRLRAAVLNNVARMQSRNSRLVEGGAEPYVPIFVDLMKETSNASYLAMEKNRRPFAS